LRARSAALAPILVTENGKTLNEAQGELQATAETLEFFAEEGRRAYGRTIPARQAEARLITLREPIGIAAVFSPWNFPALNLARKIAPALAAGCTVVAKPAEETPATPLALADCLHEAGLPPGALNLVYGDPAAISARLIASPAIAKISFTGSTAVGRILAALAGERLKRMTLELGGHAPVIICGDADPERAAAMVAAAKFRNAGQTCNSASRFYVARSLHDRFVDRLGALARDLIVGPGHDPRTQMGPLANARRLAAVGQMVADAQARGARIVAGGDRLARPGFFHAPTVLADTPDDALILREEPFGPVAPVMAFDDLDDAIARANATPYGLAAYVLTDHAPSARRLSRELRAGVVGINTFTAALPEAPFGGQGDSGWGHEGGAEGIDAYLQTRLVHEA
jgi:succinate-semialdehyde dehydrogenase/glutarate-semialdehyde dehydrogenase